MVTAIILIALVVGFTWYTDARLRIARDKAEYFEECYMEMASDNVDLRIQLEDARRAYSNLVCQRAQGWAAEHVSKVH